MKYPFSAPNLQPDVPKSMIFASVGVQVGGVRLRREGRFVGDLPVDKGAARKWMLGLTAALSAASYGVMWLLWLARIL